MAADQSAIRFGRVVTQARKKLGITQSHLAGKVGVSSSHLSNIERGDRNPTHLLVEALDRALDENGRLIRTWADLTGTGRPAWLDELADVEREAFSIQEFQLAVFSSLLQTEDYARALMRLTSPWSPDGEIENRLTARMTRAHQFVSAASPFMWLVVDRSAITRTIGTSGIMRAQLVHVVELARSGRIAVQVVDGQHSGLGGSFEIISSRATSDVVYAESPYSGQMVDDPEQIHRFRLLFGSLQAVAMPPDASLRLIDEQVEGLSDE